MLGFATGLTALLYAFRPIIFIGAFIALTFAAFHNAGLIGKAFYNKAAVSVGATDTYLLPPRSAGERLANLRQSGVTVVAKLDDPDKVLPRDIRMNFIVHGSLRNTSRWTYGTAYIACRYPSGPSGVLIEVEKRIDINLKPDTKVSFQAELVSKPIEYGVHRPNDVKCFVQDAFPIYEQS